MHILVIENDRNIPAGVIGERIAARGWQMDVRNPHEGEDLPDKSGSFDGLVVLGGPLSANDDTDYPAIGRIVHLIRDFHTADKPILGTCLGAQLLARSVGERVYSRGEFEVGYEPIRTLPEAAEDPLLKDLPGTHRIMLWHYDTFDMPAEAVPLMMGDACPNQAFRLGRASYGFQCHFEADERIVADWLDVFDKVLAGNLGARGSAEIARIRADIADCGPSARAFAEHVSENWLDLVRVRTGVGRR